MPNVLHKNFTLDNNHALPARVFANIAARDADTAFSGASDSVNKIVRVDSPLAYYILVATTPTWESIGTSLTDSFLELIDTPASYSGFALNGVRVNAGETGLEFSVDLQGITSINADTTGAHILAAGDGLGIVDAGATHTFAVDATVARSTDNLSFFSATTSAELAGVISDETGSGLLVFSDSPLLLTPGLTSPAITNAGAGADPVLSSNSATRDLLLDGNFEIGIAEPSLVGVLFDIVNLDNVFSVYVVGNYAYMAAMDSNSFAIINISDPTTPVLTGSLIDAVNLNGARNVQVVGNFAYIACATGDSFAIVDISDPTAPTFVGSLVDGANMNFPTDVYIVGNYAYVSASVSHSLSIIDISDPTNPTLTARLIDAVNMNRPSGLYVVGNYAYVTGETGDSIAVVDISDPTNPVLRDTLVDAVNMDAPRGVFVVGNHAYVAGFASDSLAVIDVSDPDNIILTGSVLTSAFLNGATGLYVSGNFAYVGAGDRLTIVDVSDPATPVVVGSLQDATNLGSTSGIYVSGKYIYAASRGTDCLTILETSRIIDVPTAFIGSLGAGNLDVLGNAVVANDLYVNGLNAGARGIGWNGVPVSRVGFAVHEIFGPGDLPAAVAGTITLTTGIYSFKSSFTLTDNIAIAAGASVILQGESRASTALTFAQDSTTFLSSTSNGSVTVNDMTILLGGLNAQLLDIDGTVLFIDAVVAFFGTGTKDLGAINNAAFVLFQNTLFTGFDSGWRIISVGQFASLSCEFTSDGTGSTTLFDIDAITTSGVVITNSWILGASETVFDFVSSITSPIIIQNSALIGTSIYYAAGALDQTSINVDADANPGSPDSLTIGSMVVGANATATVIVTQNIFVDLDLGSPGAVGAGNIERFTVTNATTGEIRYDGLPDISLDVSGLIGASSSGGGQRFNFRALKNGSVLPSPDNVDVPIEVGNNLSAVPLMWAVNMITGDTFRIQVENADGTSNITIDTFKITIR